MSIDLYVFIDHPAPLTVVEWQRALDTKHLPIRLMKNVDLQKAQRLLPDEAKR
jgi:hypothetical protein